MKAWIGREIEGGRSLTTGERGEVSLRQAACPRKERLTRRNALENLSTNSVAEWKCTVRPPLVLSERKMFCAGSSVIVPMAGEQMASEMEHVDEHPEKSYACSTYGTMYKLCMLYIMHSVI